MAPYLWLCQLVAARLGSTALRRSLLTGRTCRKQRAEHLVAEIWLSIQGDNTLLVPLQQMQFMFSSCVQPCQNLGMLRAIAPAKTAEPRCSGQICISVWAALRLKSFAGSQQPCCSVSSETKVCEILDALVPITLSQGCTDMQSLVNA